MESRRNRRNVEDNKNNSKKNKWKIVFLISLVLSVVIYNQVFVLYKYTTGQNVTEKQIALYKWVTSITSDEEKIEKLQGDQEIDIAVLGNICLSNKLQKNYIENDELDIGDIFKSLDIEDFDFTIANLDMNLSENNEAFQPIFNQFKRLGIGLLNIATEGMAYEIETDVDNTISAIKENKIDYVGDKNYYIFKKNNVKVAILSYVGKEYGENEKLNIYSEKKLDNDLKKLAKEKVDATILFIDTLKSNKAEPEEDKKIMLKEILEKDIDVIISNDTLVQEIYTKKNKEQDKYIVYSLGDLIGHQKQDNSDISKLLKISIEKEEKGKVEIGLEHEKTLVALSNEAVTRCKIVDLEKEIEEYKEDEAGNITTAEYYYLLNIKEKIK